MTDILTCIVFFAPFPVQSAEQRVQQVCKESNKSNSVWHKTYRLPWENNQICMWWCKRKLLHAICWNGCMYECNRCKCDIEFRKLLENWHSHSHFGWNFFSILTLNHLCGRFPFSLPKKLENKCMVCCKSIYMKHKAMKHLTQTAIASFFGWNLHLMLFSTHIYPQRLMS